MKKIARVKWSGVRIENSASSGMGHNHLGVFLEFYNTYD